MVFLYNALDNGWSIKKKQNSYIFTKNHEGKKEILSLDLNTLEYRSSKRAKFTTLELTKSVDKVVDRFKILVSGKDKAGELYRKSFSSLFAYVSNRIPEITHE